MSSQVQTQTIQLPEPRLEGTVSLEMTLQNRRSSRHFKPASIPMEMLGQALWAAQGVTVPGDTDSTDGSRTVPSAGALYPLDVYVAVGNVRGLEAGVFKYCPESHGLQETGRIDKREALGRAVLGRKTMRHAPAVIILVGIFGRTTEKFGRRGFRYVFMEAGHAAQNICLQAVALKLGSVAIGAFYDDKVSRVLGLANGCTPLYLLPLGETEDGIF